jgi:uncharacterized membrane protein
MHFLIGIIAYLFVGFTHTYAQTPPQPPEIQPRYSTATVQEILSEEMLSVTGFTNLTQKLIVIPHDGPQKGVPLTIDHGSSYRVHPLQALTIGEKVILEERIDPAGTSSYIILDTFRLELIGILCIVFLGLVLVIAGRKGIGAIAGLSASVAIILLYLVPQMLSGGDPLWVSIIACLSILATTTFLAHGFSRQTGIAVLVMALCLIATYVFAHAAVWLTHLTGLGTEDTYLLEMNPTQGINPQGLLLGGIIIGTLGALDDIVITQIATVAALLKQRPSLTFWEVAEQAFIVGREHIAALINTLALAYAGASLPIFIFFVLNPQDLPWWVILNSESVSEELVRTLAGTLGLVLSVPIATLLSAWWEKRMNTHA